MSGRDPVYGHQQLRCAARVRFAQSAEAGAKDSWRRRTEESFTSLGLKQAMSFSRRVVRLGFAALRYRCALIRRYWPASGTGVALMCVRNGRAESF